MRGWAWPGRAWPPRTIIRSRFAAWVLMCVAMTTPITLPAVRHVYRNSIRTRRHWACSLYLLAYNMVWLLFGVVALMLPTHLMAPQAVAVGLLVVAGRVAADPDQDAGPARVPPYRAAAAAGPPRRAPRACASAFNRAGAASSPAGR